MRPSTEGVDIKVYDKIITLECKTRVILQKVTYSDLALRIPLPPVAMRWQEHVWECVE